MPFLHDPDGNRCRAVIGHEDRGCTPATLAACDGVAFIPQLGKVGSLNSRPRRLDRDHEARRRSWSR